MKKSAVLIVSILFCLMLAFCGEHQSHREQTASASPILMPELLLDFDEIVQRDAENATLTTLLSQMSLEQKIGQLFFVRCREIGTLEDIAAYHLGGILLFGRDYKDADGQHLTKEAFTEKLQNYQYAASCDTAIPLFIGSDEEGGTVTRASRNPNLFEKEFPSPQKLYNFGGMDLLSAETQRFNEQLHSLGINVNFAPVADVSTNPKDFIYARSFGQDADATADYVGQIVKTMNAAGIGSVLKHFPGYGSNVDTHTGIAVDERSFEQFESEDFLPFAAGIEAGAPFVLVSHNIVKCMDESLPASLSPAVHKVLREKLGFNGIILPDDLAMGAVEAFAKDGSDAVLALLAGNDMILTSDYHTQYPQVLAAVKDGTISEEMIDTACLRVLQTKYKLRLLSFEEQEKENDSNQEIILQRPVS